MVGDDAAFDIVIKPDTSRAVWDNVYLITINEDGISFNSPAFGLIIDNDA